MKGYLVVSNICLSNLSLNMLSALLYESTERVNQEKTKNSGKMPCSDLTELILALLHKVVGPRHRRRSRRGGRCHHHPAPTSA
jgi:hypothetical protein